MGERVALSNLNVQSVSGTALKNENVNPNVINLQAAVKQDTEGMTTVHSAKRCKTEVMWPEVSKTVYECVDKPLDWQIDNHSHVRATGRCLA